jgi:hypothetical protein
MVIYADRVTRQDREGRGQEHEVSIPFIKSYTVFNTEQIDRLPKAFQGPTQPSLDPAQRLSHAERFIASTGAVIALGGPHACYIPSQDRVLMPAFERFRDGLAYYATVAHELIHWTGHPARLDRTFGQQRWQNSARRSSVPISHSRLNYAPNTRAISPTGWKRFRATGASSSRRRLTRNVPRTICWTSVLLPVSRSNTMQCMQPEVAPDSEWLPKVRNEARQSQWVRSHPL